NNFLFRKKNDADFSSYQLQRRCVGRIIVISFRLASAFLQLFCIFCLNEHFYGKFSELFCVLAKK
ncbi:hypothetical protein, partial [Volucribacter psittacicida]|uniref:hypothetical protein n=1 Tax=Volucribacter psittacicida TaxID=203482 RepID=UPI001A9ECB23